MPSLGGLLIALFVYLVPGVARAGSLKDVEDSARPPPHREQHDEREQHSSSGREHGGTHVYVERGAAGGSTDEPSLFGLIVLAPWALPRLLIDDPCLSGYAAYPYDDGPGQLRPVVSDACLAGEGHPLPSARAFAAQVDFEAGYVLDQIVAGTFAARLQMPFRLELSGRISLLEDLAAKPREQALSGFTHLSWRFAQSTHVQFRTGLGLRAFALHKPLYGVDMLYGMDVLAHDPVLVHIELHAGNLGDAFAAGARATIGVQLWKLELYAGYDHTAFFGDTRARLGGPVLGLRAWF